MRPQPITSRKLHKNVTCRRPEDQHHWGILCDPFSLHVALQTLHIILHTIDSLPPHKSPVSWWKGPNATNLKVINTCEEGGTVLSLIESPDSLGFNKPIISAEFSFGKIETVNEKHVGNQNPLAHGDSFFKMVLIFFLVFHNSCTPFGVDITCRRAWNSTEHWHLMVAWKARLQSHESKLYFHS